jgi:dihydrofolate reductase
MTLDGVIQAGGSPEEDKSGGFKYGGWAGPYLVDPGEAADKFMEKYRPSADLLLGKKTYEMFASFWPQHEAMWPGVNDVTKYVVSHGPVELTWQNSKLITGDDAVAQIKELKNSEGADIQVHGSANLVQTLFKHDLVDELFLMTLPITLGSGKRLFADGTIPAAFKLIDGVFASNGVAMAYYKREGEIKTANAGN